MPMTPFEPTDEQRFLVRTAIGLGLNSRQIASLVLNPRTGEAITDMTLMKAFAAEIESGSAPLVYEIGMRHREIALHGRNERESREACQFLLTRRGGPAWVGRSQQEVQIAMFRDEGVKERLQAKIARLLPSRSPEEEPPPPPQPSPREALALRLLK